MEFISLFNLVISVLFSICYAYQLLYLIVPFINRRRSHLGEAGGSFAKKGGYSSRKGSKRVAVLICARNERAVIADLIDSIRGQDYPKEKITVFVMADNCTDDTRKIAGEHGAVVYERNDPLRVGKGFALNRLISCIWDDYGKGCFDCFLVFDADNIVSPGFVSAITEKMDEGYEVVTSLRNSKNYADNWVSARNALWFLRDSQYMNRSRDILGVSCVVTGTGFAVSAGLLEKLGGWPFHLMSEDLEFTSYCVTNDIKIGYCEKAEFYDEQPVSFMQSCRQRLRWSKGYYQVYGKYASSLAKKMVGEFDFSSFDLTMSVTAAAVLTLVSGIVWMLVFLGRMISGEGMALLGMEILKAASSAYRTFFVMGTLTTIGQWDRIHAPRHKKILYMFTFPAFMRTYIPIYIAALFINVSWKPVVHTRSRSLADIQNGN